MGHTLEQIRARAKGKAKLLPTHVVPIILDLELVAQVERLAREQEDLLVDAQRTDASGRATKPPPKASQKTRNPRLDEIEAELAGLYNRIRENEGELLIRAIDGGKWQSWKDEHPAREDNRVDEEAGLGLVNTTALMAELGDYVEAWNGQPLQPGDWDEAFVPQVAPGDLRALVTAVVLLQERTGLRIPKSPSGSSTTEPGENDSDSPSTSE
jgi:hypothetical protein